MKKSILRVTLLLTLLAFTLASGMAARRHFYLSAKGEDSGPGDKNNPWRSIAYAAHQLKAGDTLTIEEGKYELDEGVYLKASGTVDYPITIQGSGHVVLDGKNLPPHTAAFDTKGKSFIQFKNIHFRNLRAGIYINGGQHIDVDNITVESSHFAILMKDAAHILIRNSLAKNNRNGFRGEGATYDVAFENVSAYASRDKHKGYNPDYLNGDGFIFEKSTAGLTFKNIISAQHWDAGLDIKGDDVVIEHVVCFGNKNGLKLWGNNIHVSNALIYGSKIQLRERASPIDGMGINVREGSSTVVYSTIANNEAEDVKVGPKGKLSLENSIVFRSLPKGTLLGPYGSFASRQVLWFDASGKDTDKITVASEDMWADPQFVNWKEYDYRLKETSPARHLEPVLGAHFAAGEHLHINMIHFEKASMVFKD